MNDADDDDDDADDDGLLDGHGPSEDAQKKQKRGCTRR